MERTVKIKQNTNNSYHFSKFLYKAPSDPKKSVRKLFFILTAKAKQSLECVVNTTHCAEYCLMIQFVLNIRLETPFTLASCLASN